MQDRQKLRELLIHDPAGAMATMVLKEDLDEQTMMSAYQSLTALARLVWERPYDPKLASRLHRVQCPTLLLWGESDRLVPPAYGQAYKKHIPHAEMKLIKNCGHLPMFEKEAEFVDTITRFCS